MDICRTCSSFNCVRLGERCKDGFVTGAYPDGVPNCQKEDAPWWVMPPEQWDELKAAQGEQP